MAGKIFQKELTALIAAQLNLNSFDVVFDVSFILSYDGGNNFTVLTEKAQSKFEVERKKYIPASIQGVTGLVNKPLSAFNQSSKVGSVTINFFLPDAIDNQEDFELALEAIEEFEENFSGKTSVVEIEVKDSPSKKYNLDFTTVPYANFGGRVILGNDVISTVTMTVNYAGGLNFTTGGMIEYFLSDDDGVTFEALPNSATDEGNSSNAENTHQSGDNFATAAIRETFYNLSFFVYHNSNPTLSPVINAIFVQHWFQQVGSPKVNFKLTRNIFTDGLKQALRQTDTFDVTMMAFTPVMTIGAVVGASISFQLTAKDSIIPAAESSVKQKIKPDPIFTRGNGTKFKIVDNKVVEIKE